MADIKALARSPPDGVFWSAIPIRQSRGGLAKQ